MQPWAKGVAAGIAFLGAFGTLFGLWWGAQDQGMPWVFWVGITLLVAFILWYPAVAAVQRSLGRARATRILIDRGKKYETMQTTIDHLRTVAIGWQDRAEHAEGKLQDWDTQTLRRGRSQAMGELSAAMAMTTFGDTDLVVLPPDEEVAIFARISSGTPPPVGAIFFIEGALARDIKAIIQCDGYQDYDVVKFHVESYKSMTHKDLVAAARSYSALPHGYKITHRDPSDDLTEER